MLAGLGGAELAKLSLTKDNAYHLLDQHSSPRILASKGGESAANEILNGIMNNLFWIFALLDVCIPLFLHFLTSLDSPACVDPEKRGHARLVLARGACRGPKAGPSWRS